TKEGRPTLFDTFDEGIEHEFVIRAGSLGLHWQNGQTGADVSATLNLTRRGGLTSSSLRTVDREADVTRPPIRFISAASLSPDVVVELFEEVVLTPSEESVIEALRVIEPSIERIATSGTERRLSTSRVGIRGGLLVRCQGIRDRIPIGSMGD